MAVPTRCKFYVHSVERLVGSEPTGEEVIKMRTEYSDSVPDDLKYSLYTPSGSMEFRVNNPAIVGKFQPGDQVYLDITPVPTD